VKGEELPVHSSTISAEVPSEW